MVQFMAVLAAETMGEAHSLGRGLCQGQAAFPCLREMELWACSNEGSLDPLDREWPHQGLLTTSRLLPLQCL